MRVSLALFSGLSSVSTVPAGSLANASSVGANTVNGPGALEGVDEAGGLQRRGQRLERTGGDRGVDDVLGLCGGRGRGDRSDRQGDGSQGSEGERFQHVSSVAGTPRRCGSGECGAAFHRRRFEFSEIIVA